MTNFDLTKDSSYQELSNEIVKHIDNKPTEARKELMDILKSRLLDNPDSANEVIQLLKTVNKTKRDPTYTWHFGMAVAGAESAEVLQQYLQLLNHLGFTCKANIMEVLNITDQYNNHLGHFICSKSNTDVVNEYLYLIENILDQHQEKSKLNELFQTITQQNNNGHTLAHLILLNQDSLVLSRLFNIMNKLCKHDVIDDKQYFTYIFQGAVQGKDRKGYTNWTLGHGIGRSHPSVMDTYL